VRKVIRSWRGWPIGRSIVFALSTSWEHREHRAFHRNAMLRPPKQLCDREALQRLLEQVQLIRVEGVEATEGLAIGPALARSCRRSGNRVWRLSFFRPIDLDQAHLAPPDSFQQPPLITCLLHRRWPG